MAIVNIKMCSDRIRVYYDCVGIQSKAVLLFYGKAEDIAREHEKHTTPFSGDKRVPWSLDF